MVYSWKKYKKTFLLIQNCRFLWFSTRLKKSCDLKKNNFFTQRAIADLHTEDPKTHKHIHGHKGILTIDLESKMESVTTLKAAYVAPKTPVGRLQGMCLYLSPARMKKNVETHTIKSHVKNREAFTKSWKVLLFDVTSSYFNFKKFFILGDGFLCMSCSSCLLYFPRFRHQRRAA